MVDSISSTHQRAIVKYGFNSGIICNLRAIVKRMKRSFSTFPAFAPIVEPVKVSSTYTKTVDSFIKAGKPIAVIRNPQVGSWIKDLKKESNAKIREQASEQLKDANVISSFYVTSKLDAHIKNAAILCFIVYLPLLVSLV